MITITKKTAMLEAALRNCVSVMSRELDGLKVILPELRQAELALEYPHYEDSAPWNGVGLPPAGTVCERMWASGPASYVRVRIIAHDNEQAIYRFIEDRRTGQVQADAQGDGDSFGNPIFRPDRTPVQIAAEERERAIDEIVQAIGGLGDNPSLPDLAGDIYDAGYRKTEGGAQ